MKLIPQSLKVYKQKSIFVKTLFFFNLFILIAILTFGYVSYTQSSSLLVEEVVKSNNKYIEQARDNIDKTLRSLDELSFQISLQSQIGRALYLSDETWDRDQLLFLDMIKYLKNVKLSNNLISDIWLQFYRYPVVVNYESKYNKDYYYSTIYKTEQKSEWNSSLSSHQGFASLGRFKISSYGVSSSNITFMRTVPLSELKPTGALYLTINTDSFSEMVQRISDPYPAFVYTVDANGKVLFNSRIRSEQDELINTVKEAITGEVRKIDQQEGYLNTTIDGRSYQVVFTSSNINDWKYISIVPTAFITEKANKIGQFTFIAALICLAGGLVMSYFLTNRIYRPINKIISYISLFTRKHTDRPEHLKEDELGFIDRIINYVYYENQSLRDSFEKNLPALQQKFLYDLIEGRVSSVNFEGLAEELQMEFKYDAFQIIVFETVDFSLEDRISPYYHNILELIDGMAGAADGSGEAHMTVKSIRKRNDKIISLLNLDHSSPKPEIIHDFIRQVTSYFEREHGRTFTVGIGNVHRLAEEVPLSYVEALSALQYKIVKGEGSVIFVDEVGKTPERSFIYSIETEKHIINCVKTGNMQALRQHLLLIWGDNLKVGDFTPEIISNLFQALTGTAIRTIYEVQSTAGEIFGDSFDLYKEVNACARLQDKKEFIERIFSSISQWIQQKKQGQNTSLFNQIQEYVEHNYHLDLSLTILGENIGLSPSYLSSIFKETTGMNFVDYINTRRVDQAKIMLRQTNETVVEISDKVGFTNSNTFIRVFKRHEGITPGQFRQMRMTEEG
ncbi:helix-turn-helix domain-containing protein [Paenibacillus radicis (ex Xue et al. 2023)]|uniref:Helix-turn-helix domain-containing protein n=1 Tax=Paenibacillus radicis (ex Xue et al. 2023) TaxID=2972489 RepID=A0ABT1YDD3_9BACL|nr:helix-turn-helix domain-containing protein [Paenibacillus radicis (ex Xue et al. 2023)]MCR8631216.1 helix-turn-helix domain-containing protein [Paenibacillus radicis (ex Xue et al. 2023)]